MPWKTYLTLIALVVVAAGLSVAALAFLPLQATWVLAGLLVAALVVRLSGRD